MKGLDRIATPPLYWRVKYETWVVLYDPLLSWKVESVAMWKREEAPRTQMRASRTDSVAPVRPTPAPSSNQGERSLGREVVNIGKSVLIKGELSGSEDLTIEGRVEGQIELRDHVLTIGPHGKIQAKVFAKLVVVMGHVTGNISASDKINIRENGAVEGDLSAPTVAISEGAQFRGSIDMKRQKQTAQGQPKVVGTDAKPQPLPTPEVQRVASGQKPGAAGSAPTPAARAAH